MLEGNRAAKTAAVEATAAEPATMEAAAASPTMHTATSHCARGVGDGSNGERRSDRG
jgi:hypothetical protein